jgi:hypothetical protein
MSPGRTPSWPWYRKLVACKFDGSKARRSLCGALGQVGEGGVPLRPTGELAQAQVHEERQFSHRGLCREARRASPENRFALRRPPRGRSPPLRRQSPQRLAMLLPYITGLHLLADKFVACCFGYSFGQFPFVYGNPLANQFDGFLLISLIGKKIHCASATLTW